MRHLFEWLESLTKPQRLILRSPTARTIRRVTRKGF